MAGNSENNSPNKKMSTPFSVKNKPLRVLDFIMGAIIVAITSLIGIHAQGPCSALDGSRGQCISVYECPVYLDLLKSKFITQDIVDTLRKAQCISRSGEASYVCCPSDQGTNNVSQGSRVNQLRSPSNGRGNQLPSVCGLEPTARKIYSGKETELDEFPWMALLEYEKKNGDWTLECTGVLINQRYILSAAHCVVGQILTKIGKLVNIRLGEYNTDTEPDCVKLGASNADVECADDVKHFGIEEVITHKDYKIDNKFERANDIALIRLTADVNFSDFIAPICLPPVNFVGTPVGKNLTVSGWGRTLETRRNPIKLKLNIPSYDFEQCKNIFAQRNVALVETQICAGGVFAEDTCHGDSGGPLMASSKNVWVVEGIVSFGLNCGLQIPGIYTRVTSFLPWIRENMKP